MLVGIYIRCPLSYFHRGCIRPNGRPDGAYVQSRCHWLHLESSIPDIPKRRYKIHPRIAPVPKRYRLLTNSDNAWPSHCDSRSAQCFATRLQPGGLYNHHFIDLHVFHGVRDAADAEAGLPQPGERHDIVTERGVVVNHDG